jgi:hypothetical protein
MANAAGLIKAVSKALAINEATVTHQHRLLREAGKVRKWGRGRGAAAMRPIDAATLLIASSTTSLLKDTVATVDKFANLPLAGRKLAGPDRALQFAEDDLLPGLNSDEVKRSFGLGRLAHESPFDRALGMIVRSCIDGSLFPSLSPGHFTEPPTAKLNLSYERFLSVRFFLPVPRVQVYYRATGVLFELLRFGGAPGEPGFRYDRDVLEPAGVGPCLVEERSFDLRSLELVAKAIGKEGIRAEFETAAIKENSNKLAIPR